MCHCSTWSAIEGTLPCFMPQPTHGMLQQAMCNSSVNGWRCKNCVVTAAVRAVGVSMRRRQCCAQQHSMRRGNRRTKTAETGRNRQLRAVTTASTARLRFACHHCFSAAQSRSQTTVTPTFTALTTPHCRRHTSKHTLTHINTRGKQHTHAHTHAPNAALTTPADADGLLRDADRLSGDEAAAAAESPPPPAPAPAPEPASGADSATAASSAILLELGLLVGHVGKKKGNDSSF